MVRIRTGWRQGMSSRFPLLGELYDIVFVDIRFEGQDKNTLNRCIPYSESLWDRYFCTRIVARL